MSNKDIPAFTPLTGQFLVAMPGMDDIRFDRTVVYVYEHSEEYGAKGLIINRPAERLLFKEILNQLKLPIPDTPLPDLLIGGPDHITQGFILHSADYDSPMTQIVSDDIALTGTQEILKDITENKGPQDFLLALGCATWQRGQLEDEIMSNVWLTVPATHEILFHTENSNKWKNSLKSVGIDAYRFSGVAGKA